jgi:hypothetical protein
VITMAFSIPFPARTKVAIVLVLHTRLFYLWIISLIIGRFR